MKKLLLLATVGYVAYTLGRNAGNRTPVDRRSAQNARDVAPPPASDDALDALAGVAAFDERQVSLASLALDRGVDAPTRSLATLLLEENNTNLARVRSLGGAIGVPVDSIGMADADLQDTVLTRLENLATIEFQEQWLSTVADEHSRMLERIDDLWLPQTSDARVAEHLRLVRDDVEMHLQNAMAIGGARLAGNAG